VVEQATYQFSSGVESGHEVVFGIQHLAPGVDAQAAKGKGDAAGDGKAQIGRRIDGQGPVGLGRVPSCTAAL
jgi:hypothetical protein